MVVALDPPNTSVQLRAAKPTDSCNGLLASLGTAAREPRTIGHPWGLSSEAVVQGRTNGYNARDARAPTSGTLRYSRIAVDHGHLEMVKETRGSSPSEFSMAYQRQFERNRSQRELHPRETVRRSSWPRPAVSHRRTGSRRLCSGSRAQREK